MVLRWFILQAPIQTDPILTGINSAGTGPVLSSMLADGSVYKTNFWDGRP